jgi:hypothetical protein
MMRKGLLLGAALLLVAAAPSATLAQKAAKGGPEFVGDALSQIFVPLHSVSAQAQPAPAKAAAKKAKRSKKAKRAKRVKAKKASRT